jgi:hypothetical protein
VMIAAAYALAKNPATVKNIRKINLSKLNPVLNPRCHQSAFLHLTDSGR